MCVCVCVCVCVYVCVFPYIMIEVYLNFVYRDLKNNPLVCGCEVKEALCGVRKRYVTILGTYKDETGEHQLSSFLAMSKCREYDVFKSVGLQSNKKMEYKFIILIIIVVVIIIIIIIIIIITIIVIIITLITSSDCVQAYLQ